MILKTEDVLNRIAYVFDDYDALAWGCIRYSLCDLIYCLIKNFKFQRNQCRSILTPNIPSVEKDQISWGANPSSIFVLEKGFAHEEILSLLALSRVGVKMDLC